MKERKSSLFNCGVVPNLCSLQNAINQKTQNFQSSSILYRIDTMSQKVVPQVHFQYKTFSARFLLKGDSSKE